MMMTTTSTEKGLKSSQENFNNNIEKHVVHQALSSYYALYKP